MSTISHAKIVGLWLTDLCPLVGGNIADAQAKTKIAAVAKLLADDFPHDATFTRASLAAMAREFTFFPSYAELVGKLGPWWMENRPASAALPGPTLDMPAHDRAMVMFWNQYRCGERKFDPSGGTNYQVWLSMIRNPAPAAFEYLIRTDDFASEIATKAGWKTEKRQGDPDAEEVHYVHKRVQDCMHAGSHSYDAPNPRSTVAPDAMDQHVPPQPLPASVVDAFEEKHGRKPGQLSPEQLEAVRQRANGPRAPANDPKPPKSNMEPTNFFEL